MKKKIYIEFTGMWGNGKTTLYNALRADICAEEEFGKVIWGREESVNTFGKLYRHIMPIVSQPLLVFSLLYFFWSIKPSSYLSNARPSFVRRKKYDLFKRVLVSSFLIRRDLYDYFIQDENVLQIVLSYFDVDEHHINYLITRNSRFHKTFFIYIDTPAQVGFSRSQIREKEVEAEKIYRQGSREFDIALYKNIREKFTHMYSLLQELEVSDEIGGVIRVDGTQSVDKNIDIIKKEIKL
jgi:thymidylate kinase